MTVVNVESVSHLIGLIYEGAYDQKRWFDVVTSLRDLLGGSRACIMRVNREASDFVSTFHDPELGSVEAVAAYMRDPLHEAANRVPLGAIYKRTQIAGEDFLRRELWQEWFRPRDMYDGLVVNLMSSNDSLWQLDVHRSAKQEPFDASEIDLLQNLMPHVLRAGEISLNIQKTASAFSDLPFGVLLVDGHQRLRQMNAAAEAILAGIDSPLDIKSGIVAATMPRDALRLQGLVRDACSSANGALPGIGGTLLLPSEYEGSGKSRLVLSVAPFVNGQLYGMSSERFAVIMLREVALRRPEGLAEHFRQVFRLTNAEATLAASLAAGTALKAAAAAQNIQFSTARYYLQQIFRKTGTHRQSELVALLEILQMRGQLD